MNAVRKSLKAEDDEGMLLKLLKEQKKLEGKKEMLMEKLLKGVIADEDYEKYSKNLTERICRLKEKIGGIKQEKEPYNNYEMRLSKIKEAVIEGKIIEKALLKETLKKVSGIEVHKEGSLTIM